MKRSKVEIIADILKSANGEGATKTQIVYKANLNFKLATGYIEYLLKKGYLTELAEHNHKIYKVTEEGVAFLKSISTICHELEDIDSFISGL